MDFMRLSSLFTPVGRPMNPGGIQAGVATVAVLARGVLRNTGCRCIATGCILSDVIHTLLKCWEPAASTWVQLVGTVVETFTKTPGVI